MEALKPYPSYRDSGLPWLGEIPEHWEVLRSKYVFREVDKRSETGEETQLSMSQVHGLVESSKIDTWRLRSESYAGGKLCEAGDLVLNRLKAHLGVFAHANIPGVISPDYTVFRPVDDIEVHYFEHLYKTPVYKAELRKRTKGIVEGFWRLYTNDFYDLRVLMPPKCEQTKIVGFIDAYDRRVRRLIRNKRRLIGLLNEKRQAIINRAVTRGLNPNAPMKPTGIDWMPEVPAHWELRKFKFFARFLSGGTPPMAESKYWTDDIPWVSPKDMKVARIASAQMSVSKKAIEEGHTPLLKPGNLMMVVRSGILRRSIPIAICDAPVTINQDIKGIVLDETVVSPSYFHLLVTGLEGSLLLAWRKQGATVESLEYQFFAN